MFVLSFEHQRTVITALDPNDLLGVGVQTRNQSGHQEKRAIKTELPKEKLCRQQGSVT